MNISPRSRTRRGASSARFAARSGPAIPDAEERISYQIPAYRDAGGTFLYFAGWKAHYSLYPASSALVAAFEEALRPYVVSKGTIRFPYDAEVPARLIADIARFRADEAARKKAS